MAYSPTAAVAQASGRTSGERAMNATNVSSCSTVTALPPARAGSGVGRRHSHAPTYPSAATMSRARTPTISRSEEHTSELQSLTNLVCRLLLEKKKKKKKKNNENKKHESK